MKTRYDLRPRTTEADWQAVRTENPIATQLRTAQRQAEQVLRGERRAAYFCGPPGVGKSYVVEEAIRTFGVGALHARPRTARELVDLFGQATKETPIILQECDHLFRSEHSLNILKLATEKHGQSVRVYVGARGAKKPGTWETVRLVASVMFTLNKTLTKPTDWPKECRDHIDALCSREPPLTITPDRAAQWEYAVYLATIEQMLRYTEGHHRPNPLQVQNDAIQWFTEHVWRLSEVSPRRLVKVMSTMMMHHRSNFRWGRGALAEDLEQLLNPTPTDLLRIPDAPKIPLSGLAQTQACEAAVKVKPIIGPHCADRTMLRRSGSRWSGLFGRSA